MDIHIKLHTCKQTKTQTLAEKKQGTWAFQIHKTNFICCWLSQIPVLAHMSLLEK